MQFLILFSLFVPVKSIVVSVNHASLSAHDSDPRAPAPVSMLIRAQLPIKGSTVTIENAPNTRHRTTRMKTHADSFPSSISQPMDKTLARGGIEHGNEAGEFVSPRRISRRSPLFDNLFDFPKEQDSVFPSSSSTPSQVPQSTPLSRLPPSTTLAGPKAAGKDKPSTGAEADRWGSWNYAWKH